MHRFVNRFPAEIVGGAINHTGLDAAAGHPHGETVRIMIASGVGLSAHEAAAGFDDGSAARIRNHTQSRFHPAAHVTFKSFTRAAKG